MFPASMNGTLTGKFTHKVFMQLGYLQPALNFGVKAAGGTCRVLVAGSSNPAIIYDPVSQDPVNYVRGIDSYGTVDPFFVSDQVSYDIYIYSAIGGSIDTIQNAAIVGGGSTPGPKGESVYLTVNPDGNATVYDDSGHTTTITNGTDGIDGINGINGINGIDGTDGVDGISLLEVRIDPNSLVNEVQYRLSSDETLWIDAGALDPLGRGLVKVSTNDTEGFLNTKLFGTGGAISIVATDTSLTFDLDPSLLVRIGALEATAIDHEARIDLLEAAKATKQVVYGGAIGDTTVIIPHTLGTSEICATCYNTVDNSIIFLSVIVSDSQISIQGLNPLVANNQIKVVLIK